MAKVYVSGMTFGVINDSQAQYSYDVFTATQGNGGLVSTVSLPSTPETIILGIKNDIISFANTGWGISVGINDIYFDNTGLGISVKEFSNPSLAVNTSRQPSTTRDTLVNASVDITSTISLITGQNGKVSLQYADNTGFSTNVVTVQSATNGNTGALTIGLNLSQVYTAALTGIIPAGKFYRLVTTNVTGTPTYGTPVIQEVLL